MKKSIQLCEAFGRAETVMRAAEASAEGANELQLCLVYTEAMKEVREIFREALTEWQRPLVP